MSANDIDENSFVSDCEMTVQTERIEHEPVVVGEGQALVVVIQRQDMSGLFEQTVPTFGIIDSSIDYSDGWPPVSDEQGSYYQSHAAEFDEQRVIRVPPSAYSLVSSRITNGLMGTCELSDL